MPRLRHALAQIRPIGRHVALDDGDAGKCVLSARAVGRPLMLAPRTRAEP